ncbi:MAG: hypothetical protein GTO14_25320 [Anaerolineales bacterium]|nr:hypothetical protein [Anaerolineales bacterium]
MDVFKYHPEILQHYPSIIGGVILAREVHNAPSPTDLSSTYLAEQKRTLERIDDTPLSSIPSLAAWRRVFRDFGVKPTQYRSAAEALLRRLTKHGDIPSINTLVDLANLVSIRYALPVAVFDTQVLQLPITVQFAEGNEHFLPLGAAEPVHPQVGEVVFSDTTRRVIARRWCWRQSDDSAAQIGASEVVITVEGHHETARSEVSAALQDLTSLLDRFSGGHSVSATLSADSPTFRA